MGGLGESGWALLALVRPLPGVCALMDDQRGLVGKLLATPAAFERLVSGMDLLVLLQTLL